MLERGLNAAEQSFLAEGFVQEVNRASFQRPCSRFSIIVRGNQYHGDTGISSG